MNFANCWLTGSDIDPGVDAGGGGDVCRNLGDLEDASLTRRLIFFGLKSIIWESSTRRRDHIFCQMKKTGSRAESYTLNDKYIGV